MGSCQTASFFKNNATVTSSGTGPTCESQNHTVSAFTLTRTHTLTHLRQLWVLRAPFTGTAVFNLLHCFRCSFSMFRCAHTHHCVTVACSVWCGNTLHAFAAQANGLHCTAQVCRGLSRRGYGSTLLDAHTRITAHRCVARNASSSLCDAQLYTFCVYNSVSALEKYAAAFLASIVSMRNLLPFKLVLPYKSCITSL